AQPIVLRRGGHSAQLLAAPYCHRRLPMRSSVSSLRVAPVVAVLGAAVLAATLGGVAMAGSDPGTVVPISANASLPPGSAVPGDPGDGSVTGVPATIQPAGDGAKPVTPTDKVRDVHPVAIDHLNVAGDGKTVTIYWYGGVDTCYALASVDVTN